MTCFSIAVKPVILIICNLNFKLGPCKCSLMRRDYLHVHANATIYHCFSVRISVTTQLVNTATSITLITENFHESENLECYIYIYVSQFYVHTCITECTCNHVRTFCYSMISKIMSLFK